MQIYSFTYLFLFFSRLLRQELTMVDKSYSSDYQQDVSEFFMDFLNFMKTEFDKLIAKKLKKLKYVIESAQGNSKITK